MIYPRIQHIDNLIGEYNRLIYKLIFHILRR